MRMIRGAVFFLLATSLCANAWAQEFPESPKQLFLSQAIEVSELPASAEVLSQVLPILGEGQLKADQFHLESYRVSPQGYHYLFHFHIAGIEAEGQYIRVFLDRNLVLRQTLWNLRGTHLTPSSTFADSETLRGRLVGFKHVGEIKPVWRFDPSGWQALLKVSVIEDLAAFAEFRYYDADYQEVGRVDNAARFKGKDSLIQANVFYPDPLTSAQVPYGGAYQDFQDSDTSSLNNERYWRPLVMDFHADSFFLRDSVFYYAEIENPISQQPILLQPIADFTRAQQEFEYFNSFYHLQTWVRRVHDLGYNLPGMPIQVDPHAANGSDVSAFTSGLGDLALLFGEGGIDDAEDADVLVHELGHALSYAAAPSTTNGIQRTSMEEGTCDYFAMSYSRQIIDFGWQKTFNWDGNVTWQGRVVNTTKVLPANYSSNKYSNAEIWVAALTEIYDSLGPDITDRLVLCALYNQVNEMEFYQMVNNCLQCDSIQNGGVNAGVIFRAMNNRGLAKPLGFSSETLASWRLLNTSGFAFREEALTLDFGGVPFTGKIEVFDLQGKCLYEQDIEEGLYFSLNEPITEKGLYLLRVTSDTNLSITYRIARH